MMFKKYYVMIINTIYRIPSYLWFFSYLIPLYFMHSRGLIPQISNKVWESLYSDRYLMFLWLPIGLLVLLSGVGIPKEDDAMRYSRMNSRRQLVCVNLLSTFCISVLYIISLIMIYALYFRFFNKMSLSNTWSAEILTSEQYFDPYSNNLFPTPVVFKNFSPIGAMVISALFLCVYCFFVSTVSITVNTVFKQSVGSIACALILLATSIFGARRYTSYSLYPDYNGTFRALTETGKINYVYIAIVYWMILCSMAVGLYAFCIKKIDLIGLSREDEA